MKLVDKLWNWGHLEGSHNAITGHNCKMSPEQFAEEYGIRNSFIVSYGGNIQVPFDSFAERFSGLREIVWSVLGDGSTPLPEAELGNTEDILAVLHENSNITGGVVDTLLISAKCFTLSLEAALISTARKSGAASMKAFPTV